ncbi:MAG: glucuronate isomerase [Clostridia bacterium]|nr:glucuronate isomerase [Clostridia bacterium]
MNQFCDKNFLLTTQTAKSLFQSVAGLPIIDCHSHLTAKEIAENQSFDNITQVWLNQDPEKLQAMRAVGLDEYYITGEAGDYEKFQKWAETVPTLLGNALYHRTHMELQRYFGIFEPLSPANTEQIWNRANEIICGGHFTLFELLQKFQVEVICTLEDPADELIWHQKLSEEGNCPATVLPAFCTDTALQVGNPTFSEWLGKLETACSQEINSYATLQACLLERLLYFKSVGCKTTLQTISIPFTTSSAMEDVEMIFQKAKNNQTLTETECAAYQAQLFSFLIKKYQDYRFSAEIRTENEGVAESVIVLLEQIAKEHKLPKTVITPKNPSDAGKLANKLYSSEISGRIRIGGCEGLSYQKIAIKKMLKSVVNNGVLSLFHGFSAEAGGMFSYPAHEYFRRVLCDVLGNLVESGEYPNYSDLLKKFAKDICYENKKSYFGL